MITVTLLPHVTLCAFLPRVSSLLCSVSEHRRGTFDPLDRFRPFRHRVRQPAASPFPLSLSLSRNHPSPANHRVVVEGGEGGGGGRTRARDKPRMNRVPDFFFRVFLFFSFSPLSFFVSFCKKYTEGESFRENIYYIGEISASPPPSPSPSRSRGLDFPRVFASRREPSSGFPREFPSSSVRCSDFRFSSRETSAIWRFGTRGENVRAGSRKFLHGDSGDLDDITWKYLALGISILVFRFSSFFFPVFRKKERN